MIKKLYEYVDNPYYNIDIRKKNGVFFNYKKGYIYVKFNDEEEINKKTGELSIDYHNNKNFLKWFENKFKLKLVDGEINDENTDNHDYYHLFKCDEGDEINKIIDISKYKFVTSVDLVYTDEIEITQILTNVTDDLNNLIEKSLLINNETIKKTIISSIEKLNKILNDYKL